MSSSIRCAGVPRAEIPLVSELLATKLVENEFAAYLDLQALMTSSDADSPSLYMPFVVCESRIARDSDWRVLDPDAFAHTPYCTYWV